MNVPGFKGLNTQQASGTLGPEWCTKLENAVIDDNGRVAARKGWSALAAGPTAARYVHVTEIVKSDGTTTLFTIDATLGNPYYSTDGGATWNGMTTAMSGLSEPHESSIVSFNNKAYIFSKVASPGVAGAVWDPDSPAATTSITSTSVPRSGNVVAAFGRLWGAGADGHSLHYSALLDGTDWDGTDAGVLDMWNVWPGNDQITAIATFNGALVVFGKRCVVMWTDGAGSALGIDPTSMYVVDVVQGTGCISRHSIQHVDGDMWFLSEFGLQSLGRVIQEKSNPIDNLSKNIQDYLGAAVAAANMSYVRSVYSPRDKVYLLALPSGGSTESGRCFVFDTRGRLEDGAVRSLGTWTLVPTAVTYRRNGTLLFARNTSEGFGVYEGQLDNTAAYILDYESGWIDLTNEGFLIFPKRIGGIFFSDASISLTFKWATDFEQNFTSRTRVFTAPGQSGTGEWGASEWGLAEFGGGVNLSDGHVQGSGSGEFIKLGLTCQINNNVLAIQQLELFAKIGRYAS